jgi:hypothetical protein
MGYDRGEMIFTHVRCVAVLLVAIYERKEKKNIIERSKYRCLCKL